MNEISRGDERLALVVVGVVVFVALVAIGRLVLVAIGWLT